MIHWLVYNAQSILVLRQVFMLSLRVCVFSEQGDESMKKNGPGDPEFQNASVTVSSEFWM